MSWDFSKFVMINLRLSWDIADNHDFLYWQVASILSLLLYPEHKKAIISLRLPPDIFKTKFCSKLALQSTVYCAALTQSR